MEEDAVAAGFYAVSYDWNGETVISYRGTDTADPQALAKGQGMLKPRPASLLAKRACRFPVPPLRVHKQSGD